jgi:hypothetical protein
MRIERTLSLCLVAAFGLSLLPGCKPESSSVPAKLNTWERSRFEPGGGNAMMCYAIYGTFIRCRSPLSAAAPLRISVVGLDFDFREAHEWLTRSVCLLSYGRAHQETCGRLRGEL